MNNIFIVLVRPSISGNIGAVARTMANFGFSNLILVNPKCKIDDDARNRAKHAQSILNTIKIESSLEKAVSKFSISVATTGILGSDFNILRSPLLVEDAAKKICESNGKRKIAVIFGPEDSGLSKEELELCNYTVTIPASKTYPVMNLSHAVSIFLYELSKNVHSEKIKKDFPLVEKKEKDALENAMMSAIESVNYRTPFEKKTQILVWKRILGKAMPTRREAFAMIGLLKKLAGKNKSEKEKIEKKSDIKIKNKNNKKVI